MELTENLTAPAIRAAIEAGEAIMQVYESPETDWQVERKADNSPLTLADRQAHAVIADRLAATGLPLLSEEGAHAAYDARKAWRRLWIADPLDGTKEFLKRNGEFTVNIALVEDGVPVFGVIFVPATRTLYRGQTGTRRMACKLAQVPEGVYAVGEATPGVQPLPLPDSDRGEERPYVVVASRSHLSPETEAFIAQTREAHGRVETRAAGSSLKICLVAEGRADVYPRFAPTMEWDTAAGHAILRAAGGEICGTDDGAPLVYNKPDLHNPWFIARP